MTTISTVYDAIVTELGTQLPQHTRLPNPYLLAENSYLTLDKGFAVAILDGLDTRRYINNCFVTWERRFAIALVRRLTTTDHNQEIRSAIEKEILEDHDKIRKAFYNNNNLSGTSIDARIESDSGISFVDVDTLKFLSIELTLVVEYQESPS